MRGGAGSYVVIIKIMHIAKTVCRSRGGGNPALKNPRGMTDIDNWNIGSYLPFIQN